MFGSWAIHCNVFANVIQDEATEDSNIIDVLGDLTKNIAKADPLTKALEKQIPQATPLTNSLKTQIPQATELVNEMKSAIEEGGTVDRRELGEFTKGYTGKEYDNLDHRINGDIDHVQQQINDSSLLPYEGTNIKADNTYYGLTKEATVKGRTLQNLWGGLANFPDNNFTIRRTSNNLRIYSRHNTVFNLTDGKFYTVIFELYNVSGDTNNQITVSMDDGNSAFLQRMGNIRNGVFIGGKTLSDYETAKIKRLMFYIESNTDHGECSASIRNIVVLEGDYTNTPIEELPFIEGIQSVGENEVQEDGKYLISGKSCGKNLINHNKWSKSSGATINDNNDGSFTLTTTSPWSGIAFKDIKLKSNTTYTLNCKSSQSNIGMYVRVKKSNGNYNEQAYWGGKLPAKFTTGDKAHIVQVSVETISALENVIISEIQLEENTVATPYEPYQESTYSYILNEPLRQLPNGVADSINLETGVLTRRVGKVVLDGSESWELSDAKFTNSIGFRTLSTPFKQKSCGISDLFIYKENTGVDYECFTLATDRGIHIRVLKSKLQTEDVAGFKTWLQANPTTVYYELAEPTTEQLEPTQLKSFEGTTHIVSNNTLQATTSVKIPSNVQMVVQNLRAENKALNVELKDTKAELENTDLDILEMNWETDFRVCELEYAIYSQEARAVSLETNSRAISKYEQAKTLIEANRYNKPTMTRQLTVYLERGYITEEEYNELIAMME